MNQTKTAEYIEAGEFYTTVRKGDRFRVWNSNPMIRQMYSGLILTVIDDIHATVADGLYVDFAYPEWTNLPNGSMYMNYVSTYHFELVTGDDTDLCDCGKPGTIRPSISISILDGDPAHAANLPQMYCDACVEYETAEMVKLNEEWL